MVVPFFSLQRAPGNVILKERLVGGLMLCCSLLILAGSVWLAWHVAREKRLDDAAFGKVAPTDSSHVYTDLEGNPFSLSSYRGKSVLVIAWASWCPQCAEQMDMIARIVPEVAPALPIIAINRKEDRGIIRDYLSIMGRHNALIYVIDVEDHFFKTSHGYAMPEYILYDAEGNERFRAHGTITPDELRQAVLPGV